MTIRNAEFSKVRYGVNYVARPIIKPNKKIYLHAPAGKAGLTQDKVNVNSSQKYIR